jgi:transposase InsO family protein
MYRERKDQKRKISRKLVARLMREADLSAWRRRHRVLTTKRDASHPVAPPVLHREFTATAPNTKWVTAITSITSISTMQGWLYLAVLLDVYAQAVVGWSMSKTCDEALAENALKMAVARRRPAPGFVHHSDRGRQYTSRASQN